MATCRATVNLALRKLGRLAAGREARQADTDDALDALRSLYTSWVVSGAFGRLVDVMPIGLTYTATGGERVFRTKNQTFTVELPELVADGWGDDYGHRGFYYGTTTTIDIDGTITITSGQTIGRCVSPPRDGAVVVVTDSVCGETRTFIYDGSIKKWQLVDGLTLDDEAPRSIMDPQGLAACLAVEISDQFGVDPPAVTQMQAARFRTAITSRFSMPRSQAVGVYC